MPSILPGYKYDIFISYRQKDNKGDRWVSEFVDALKVELEATFKEEISVYFDINPDDGLLETHDVDESLKEKLKCLIFIPIISRTYCDPNAFAWEHEFKAFIEQASKDQFGLKVTLPNGNVSNRVLPVRIHELDNEDLNLCESFLGGALRGVEFIYKESGVNRPLRANEDHPHDNLNKTYYRDQINKVANALKEIISSIKKINRQNGIINREHAQTEPESSKNMKPKILLTSFMVMALIVLGYLFIPKLFEDSKPVEKSIAVLPFFNDSPDEENTHFINGIMDEILNNLQAIKDLKVISRTSVEQYRGTDRPTIPEIAKKLDVNYIVEGSGQKYGNSFRLRVQLIEAYKDRHLWAKSFEQEIIESKDIFSIQSLISENIAAELEAVITPKEKQQIDKISTTNLTAYDFYQRGRDEHLKYLLNNNNITALEKAEEFYHKSLEYDSAYANAFTGLARVYWDKHYWDTYFTGNFLDSVFILSNIALSFDNQVADAYSLKGDYYRQKGDYKKALEEYDKALEMNPNYWQAYASMGDIYYYYRIDVTKALEFGHKALSLNHGPELPGLLRQLASCYYSSGFPDKAIYYRMESLKLDGDSARYYNHLALDAMYTEDFKKAIEFGEKAYASDSNNLDVLYILGQSYVLLAQYKKSLDYFQKYTAKLKDLERLSINNMHRVGYCYWKNGLQKEAEYYFNEQIRYCEESIRLNRDYARNNLVYYDLAGIYAFKGDKKKAYENLRIYNTRIGDIEGFDILSWLKTDPLFDNFRKEPEFIEIEKALEVKYQNAHEIARKWLEEQGML